MTTSFIAYIDESGDEGVVFLPGEKPNAPNIPKQEVVDAADAVEKFLDLVRTK